MKSKIKHIRNRLRKYFPFLVTFGKSIGLVYSNRSFLVKSGYVLSCKMKQPYTKEGAPIPWMNYNAISFLEQRLNSSLSLFEYGSGNSTLFFAKLVGKIISIECEKGWYDHIIKQMPENVELQLCDPYDPAAYSKIILRQDEKFDVVIIDAEDRVECLKSACDSVTEQGVIILDDSQREHYQPGIDYLTGKGFKKLDFEGLKPGSISLYRTTVFYRSLNCLDI